MVRYALILFISFALVTCVVAPVMRPALEGFRAVSVALDVKGAR